MAPAVARAGTGEPARSCPAAARTRSRVSGATWSRPFSTRDTVAMDTPVCAAMSRTVTRRPSGRLTICYTAVFHDRSIGSGRPKGGYHRPFGPLLLTSWGPYWFATRHNKFQICSILLHDGND